MESKIMAALRMCRLYSNRFRIEVSINENPDIERKTFCCHTFLKLIVQFRKANEFPFTKYL